MLLGGHAPQLAELRLEGIYTDWFICHFPCLERLTITKVTISWKHLNGFLQAHLNLTALIFEDVSIYHTRTAPAPRVTLPYLQKVVTACIDVPSLLKFLDLIEAPDWRDFSVVISTPHNMIHDKPQPVKRLAEFLPLALPSMTRAIQQLHFWIDDTSMRCEAKENEDSPPTFQLFVADLTHPMETVEDFAAAFTSQLVEIDLVWSNSGEVTEAYLASLRRLNRVVKFTCGGNDDSALLFQALENATNGQVLLPNLTWLAMYVEADAKDTIIKSILNRYQPQQYEASGIEPPLLLRKLQPFQLDSFATKEELDQIERLIGRDRVEYAITSE